MHQFSCWVLNIDFSVYFASYRHRQRTAVGKHYKYLVFKLCKQDAHKTQRSGNSYIKTPHTVYINFLTRKLCPERWGRKRILYCSFSACALWSSSSENWYSLMRHYIWSDQKKETRSNFLKKNSLTVGSKKISSDFAKFMISEKSIQPKPEHSQSEKREERYLHCLLTVLSHAVPPHVLANWHIQPSGNSVSYIWT